jgi:adenosine 3'-phospho 5'-phosphosulfate transporter B3
MFKCCKLIPVLIGGIIIQSKRIRLKKEKIHCFFYSEKKFNRYDVAATICMSIGLIFFTLADSKVQPNFNTYG